jgi:hypothetical protein
MGRRVNQTNETAAVTADRYVYEILRTKTLPSTFMPVTLACPSMSAAKVSHALTRLVKGGVIVAQSTRFKGVTYWRVEQINPSEVWGRKMYTALLYIKE